MRDAGQEEDALRLFAIVAAHTETVIVTWYFIVYPDQELPEKIHTDYAELLRQVGRDADAKEQEARVEWFRARRLRMEAAQ